MVREQLVCDTVRLVRRPGLIPPHAEVNDIFSAEDWVTTLVAAAGEPDVKNKLLQGYTASDKSFTVHLDGYDRRDLLARTGPNKRRESSTGRTTATSPAFGTSSGKPYSWSRKRMASMSGLNPWRSCACPYCSICAGPARAGPARGGRLREVVYRTRLCARPRAVDRRGASGELCRTGHGETQEPTVEQLTASPGTRKRDRCPGP